MDKMDSYMGTFYLQLVCDEFGVDRPSKEFLLQPSREVLEELYSEFLGTTKQYATFSHLTVLSEVDRDLLETDNFDNQVFENEKEQIALIFKKAVIYMLSNYQDTYEGILNRILAVPMSELTREFLAQTSFSKEVFQFYIFYLIQRRFGDITIGDEENLETKYAWLETLEHNRGFMTINDKARWGLKNVVLSISDRTPRLEDAAHFLDAYFNDYTSLGLSASFANEFSGSKEEIRAFKKYQLGLLMSDVYRYLKGTMLQDRALDDYESEAEDEDDFLELLESYLEYGDIDVLPSKKFRHELYRKFYFILVTDVSPAPLTAELEKDSRTHVLKPLNPIYFLD